MNSDSMCTYIEYIADRLLVDLDQPKLTSNRSAIYSIYVHILSEFIPINFTGNASVRNSFSISTAEVMISRTLSGEHFCCTCCHIKQANLVCNPSSLEINSFEKVNPGINPLFFNQKIAAKDPEKNMPSTAANARTRSGNVEFLSLIQLKAQSAFLRTQGMVSIAPRSFDFS